MPTEGTPLKANSTDQKETASKQQCYACGCVSLIVVVCAASMLLASGMSPQSRAPETVHVVRSKALPPACSQPLERSGHAQPTLEQKVWHTKALSIVALLNAQRKRERLLQAQFRALVALNVSRYVNFHDQVDAAFYSQREWFTRLCTLQSSAFGSNPSTIRAMLLSRREVLRSQFSHVWILESAIELPPFDHIRYLLRSIEIHDPLVTSPSLPFSSHESMHPALQSRGCNVRSVDFVELQAPVLPLHAALDVFTHLINSSGAAGWGVDQVWCRYLSRRYPQKGCIIVDPTSARSFEPVAARSYNRAQLAEHPVVEANCEHRTQHQTLACLEADTFNAAEAILPNGTESEHRAAMMRLYVYNVPRCTPSTRMAFGQDNFEWEYHVEHALRAIFNVTTNASEADFFFLPGCPVNAWAETWRFDRTHMLRSSCPQCIRDYESAMVTAMRKVGLYYDTAPEKHLMTRLRCPSFHERLEEPLRDLYPQLWGNPRMKFVCLETQHGDHARETDREVHVPYYAHGTAHQAAKKREIGFVGSQCCGRETLVGGIPDALVLSHFDIRGTTNKNVTHAELLDYTASSKFMYQPVGDTPERRSIYQSIAVGTPLLFDQIVRPPLRLPSWGGVALRANATNLTSNGLHAAISRALDNYQETLRAFERDRNKFLWDTEEFKTRFRKIVTSLFWRRERLDRNSAMSMTSSMHDSRRWHWLADSMLDAHSWLR